MRTTARLGLYGVGLVAVFVAAFFTAAAVVPEETVQNWTQDLESHGENHGDGHDEESATGSTLGLAREQNGYRLDAVRAPAVTDTADELTLQVHDEDGVVTDFDLSHEKELHLIVVRADGAHFAHVHPERDDDGTWRIPWRWEAAGTYRVFADFVPTGAEDVTISTTVQVAGTVDPVVEPELASSTQAGEFTVTVHGEVVAGTSSAVTATVTRDGDPVTELEPYLGAFGHLVALRHGDLAYLHVHPRGAQPQLGETSGPEIEFDVEAPTPGRYLLYLDFQVGGEVYTAPLVLDAVPFDTLPAEKDSDDDH